MAKDPAFLFYSDRFISGVQTMSFEDRGRYITLLALMHQQGRMDEETIRFLVGSISVKLKSKFKQDENGLWYNTTLEKEVEKRKKFTESRIENGKLGGRPKKDEKPIGLPTDNLMPNLPVNVNKDINNNTTELYVVPEMLKILLKHHTKYQPDKENDFPALWQIAQKIAKTKGWQEKELSNGKLQDCLTSWEKIVKFIRNDDFYKKLELSTIAKKWNGLILSMEAAKEGSSKQTKEIDPTKVKITRD